MVHDADPVGHLLGHTQLVGRDEHRHPLVGTLAQDVLEHTGVVWVQPTIGSSSTNTSGACISAETIATRCLVPCDSPSTDLTKLPKAEPSANTSASH